MAICEFDYTDNPKNYLHMYGAGRFSWHMDGRKFRWNYTYDFNETILVVKTIDRETLETIKTVQIDVSKEALYIREDGSKIFMIIKEEEIDFRGAVNKDYGLVCVFNSLIHDCKEAKYGHPTDEEKANLAQEKIRAHREKLLARDLPVTIHFEDDSFVPLYEPFRIEDFCCSDPVAAAKKREN